MNWRVEGTRGDGVEEVILTARRSTAEFLRWRFVALGRSSVSVRRTRPDVPYEFD